MSPGKRYDREPGSIKTIDARLRNIVKADEALSEDVLKRLRREIAGIILGQILARVVDTDGKPVFLIKGGVAMSLRLGLRARATKDFDVACRIDMGTAIDLLRDEMIEGWGPFRLAFAQDEPVEIRKTGALRIDVKERLGGDTFSTVQLEIAPAEGAVGHESEFAHSQLLGLDRLGLEKPDALPMVTVAYLIAQKLHACTDHADLGRVNDRFRDLIDIQLLQSALDDESTLRSVAVGCQEIFTLRGKHSWPPAITVVDGWEVGYANLAVRMKFSPADVHAAARIVDGIIAHIDSAAAR